MDGPGWKAMSFGFEDEGIIPSAGGKTDVYWCRPTPDLLCTVWYYGDDELIVDIKAAATPPGWSFDEWCLSRNGTVDERRVPVDNPILVPVMIHELVARVTSGGQRCGSMN